jgi:hypothetical protein
MVDSASTLLTRVEMLLTCCALRVSSKMLLYKVDCCFKEVSLHTVMQAPNQGKDTLNLTLHSQALQMGFLQNSLKQTSMLLGHWRVSQACCNQERSMKGLQRRLLS